MEPPQILALHHQQWKPHTEEEDTEPSFLQPVPKVSRFLSPLCDASRMSGMSSSPVGLGLGLGSGSGQNLFTYSQLQELEHQALIFKYMVAGAPVPLHLVLPIWKSVVSAPLGGGFPPSSLSGGALCFDFRNSMEPEPGRCRRTDGKKWRCSKEVVPDHKYCEKHMHRGRNRSRKPVERQPLVEPPKKAMNSVANSISIIGNNSDSSTRLSISISDGIELVNNRPINANSNTGLIGSISSSTRLEFSPTTVLPKSYYGCSISDSSSGSTSKTEFNLS